MNYHQVIVVGGLVDPNKPYKIGKVVAEVHHVKKVKIFWFMEKKEQAQKAKTKRNSEFV